MTKRYDSSLQPRRIFDAPASSQRPELASASRPEGHTNYLRGAEEMLIDFRQRLELDAKERIEKRRIDMAEQTREPNGAAARIRAWEKVHGLRMPSSPEHPVLTRIAAATQLTLAEVNEEQRARAARTPASAPTS